MSGEPVTSSAAWKKPLYTKEHQNWLGVGHALLLLCTGIRPYVEQQMKAFYTQLKTTVGTTPTCSCTYNPKQKPNPWHKASCSWANFLQLYHLSGKPKWQQSDSNKWADPNLGYWEIAKLFMSDLGTHRASVVDVESTDPTGLLNLMYWCSFFKVNKHLLADVRDTRNVKWGHAAKQELIETEKSDAFSTIIKLLEDPEFATDKDAQHAKNATDKDAQHAKEAVLELKKVDIIDDIVEKKVMKDFQDFITRLKCDIEVKMAEGQLAISTNLTSLTEEVRKVKILMEDLNQRLNTRKELQNEIFICNAEDIDRYFEKLKRLQQSEGPGYFQYFLLIMNTLINFVVRLRWHIPRIQGIARYFFIFIILIVLLHVTEKNSSQNDGKYMCL